MRLTTKEMQDFKALFVKYCQQEASLGHCEPAGCEFCPVNMALSEIFEKFANGENPGVDAGDELNCKTRLPTCAEWDALVQATGGNNTIIHWDRMYSWCRDADPDWASPRAVRGYYSARSWLNNSATYRYVHVGFRPTFEVLHPDPLTPDGTIITVGTLYMDGKPVRVPKNPTWDGDIPDYAPGTKLELRETLDDHAYQVQAIRVGDVLIADRILLKNISWEDLAAQGIC